MNHGTHETVESMARVLGVDPAALATGLSRLHVPLIDLPKPLISPRRAELLVRDAKRGGLLDFLRNPEAFVTTAEAAEMLGKSQQCIHSLVKRGVLEAIPVLFARVLPDRPWRVVFERETIEALTGGVK